MEFNIKLQELRKQKGLTQEELAKSLYVSRTAISKWESGRGYPNIDSLKAIAKFFGITVDELLSSDELLTLAEKNNEQKESHFRDLIFGLLDISVSMLLFLPFFGEKSSGFISNASLLSLSGISPYLRILYYILTAGIILCGVLTLAMQKCEKPIWLWSKNKLSLLLSSSGAILFVISLQPYAATYLLIISAIKALTLIKWQ